MTKKRDIHVEIDRETHRELKILAAIKSLSIKKCLKEMVEEAKKNSSTEYKTPVAGSKVWNEKLEIWE